MWWGLGTQGDPPDLGESIAPRKGPQNWHPISFCVNGQPRGIGLPQFSNREKRRCCSWRRAGDIGDRWRGHPSALCNDWRVERAPINMNGSRAGTTVCRNWIRSPEFLSNSLAETPMSCKRQQKMAGKRSGSKSSQANSPKISLQSAPFADGGVGECGNSGSDVWGCHWHWLGKCRTGTNEPTLARTSCCSIGRIAVQVPMSWLARICMWSFV